MTAGDGDGCKGNDELLLFVEGLIAAPLGFANSPARIFDKGNYNLKSI